MRQRVAVLGLSIMLIAGAAFGQGLTQQQGDEILKELRAMRMALEKLAAGQQQAARAPSAVAPAAGDDRAKLANTSGYALGKADAPLTMVEFTDLQCPFCRRFSSTTFDEIKKAYIDTGLLRFVTRDLPLTSIHPHAQRAALACRCAGEQGKFWELRHALLTSSTPLSPELITSTATGLGLDMTGFNGCLEGERFLADVQRDMAEAGSVGIGGTPGFVIGRTSANGLDGVRLSGAQPFAAFEAKFKELLAAKPAAR
jgi:protein-disulfide isomerase